MTATMDFHTELITIQNELKKYIFHHQMLRLNKKSTDLDSRLSLYEKKIIQLSERQKVVVNNLRKERINASNLDHHQLVSKSFYVHNNQQGQSKQKTFLGQPQDKQIRTSFGNNKKLLIPVSAATATSKKTNQQILVVQTPDGGARLAATSANASSLTKSPSFIIKNSNGSSTTNSNSLLHPSGKSSTQFNNFTITNTTTHGNSLNLKHSRIVHDKSNTATTTTTNSLLANELITSASVKRKQVHSHLVDRSQQQQTFKASTAPQATTKVAEPKVDEVKVKAEFMYKLGLVTKQALSEILNKKSERKRRTTANPQFSNAAIEAKRITAQEQAAKKANRKRELAASNQDNLINNSSSAATGNKRSFLNSNRGKQVVGKQADAKKNVPKVSNSNNSKQQFNQTNEIIISSNCFVCDEVCDSDLDEIMFCENCHCLFHVTCSSTIDRIKKTMGVPCPKCERRRSLADDAFNDNSNESNNVLKQKALDSSNSNSSSVAGSKAGYRRKLENSKPSKNLKATTGSKLNDKIVATATVVEQAQAKQSIKAAAAKTNEVTAESKLDEERYESLVKYQQLDRQVRDFRIKLALLKDKVYISKENRREMLAKKENSKRAIESIINLVKRIQELENSEQKENQVSPPRDEISVDKLNEVVLTANESTDQLMDNGDEAMVVALNEEIIADYNENVVCSNQAIKPAEEMVINDKHMIDETNEAVNNLNEFIGMNALATMAVAELNEMNSLNSLNSNLIVSTTEEDVVTTNVTTIDLEDVTPTSDLPNLSIDQQCGEEPAIENLVIEEECELISDEATKHKLTDLQPTPVDLLNELVVNEVQIESISSNQSSQQQTQDVSELDQVHEDEPPTKKLRQSPEHQIEEQFIVSQSPIDDEVSAAIASIQ